MSDQNIKPVSATSRNLPLRIGSREEERAERGHPSPWQPSRSADSAREKNAKTAHDNPADEMDFHAQETQPQTYSSTPIDSLEPSIDVQAKRPEGADAVSRKQALADGRREGYEAGYAEGIEAGRQAAAEERDTEKAHAEALVNALLNPLEAMREEIVTEVTEGARSLARVLLNAALPVDADLMRHTVADILDEAAANKSPGARLQLRVAVDDRTTTESLIHSRHGDALPIDVIEDEQLTRGDIQATLIHDNGDPANQVEWDARLETRWETIRQILKIPRS